MHLNGMKVIQDALAAVSQRIRTACQRAGRSEQDVSLIAVTKGVAGQRMVDLPALGISRVGESRVQELLAKQKLLDAALEWHFIGKLQTNKVRSLINRVQLIHSLDRSELAHEISIRSVEANATTSVLLQINCLEAEERNGIPFGDALRFLEQTSKLPGIRITGLMTIAPQGDEAIVRPVFRRLYELRNKIDEEKLPGVKLEHLSMGMSEDFEIAIEEGATLIRVGSALFGPRSR